MSLNHPDLSPPSPSDLRLKMIYGVILMTNTTAMSQGMDIFQAENQERIIRYMINQLFELKHNNELKERNRRESINFSD